MSPQFFRYSWVLCIFCIEMLFLPKYWKYRTIIYEIHYSRSSTFTSTRIHLSSKKKKFRTHWYKFPRKFTDFQMLMQPWHTKSAFCLSLKSTLLPDKDIYLVRYRRSCSHYIIWGCIQDQESEYIVIKIRYIEAAL